MTILDSNLSIKIRELQENVLKRNYKALGLIQYL